MCLNAQRVEQGNGVRNEKSVIFEVAENAKVDSQGKDKNRPAAKVIGLGGRRRVGGRVKQYAAGKSPQGSDGNQGQKVPVPPTVEDITGGDNQKVLCPPMTLRANQPITGKNERQKN